MRRRRCRRRPAAGGRWCSRRRRINPSFKDPPPSSTSNIGSEWFGFDFCFFFFLQIWKGFLKGWNNFVNLQGLKIGESRWEYAWCTSVGFVWEWSKMYNCEEDEVHVFGFRHWRLHLISSIYFFNSIPRLYFYSTTFLLTVFWIIKQNKAISFYILRIM